MRLFHQYRASTLAGIKDGYGFPSAAPCSGFFCVPGFPRSDSPIIWMLVGVPSEPAFSFRRAACNGAWNFITTHFTFPRTRHGSHGFCLSTNAMFRLVPSGDWSARAFLRILTLSIRRPAYWQHRPMWAGFGGVPLRLSRLYRAFDDSAAARSIANRRIGVDVSGRCPVIPSIGLSVLSWQGLTPPP